MIRMTVLAICVLCVCVYAWRDWRMSAYGLLVMTMLTQHGDMPTKMAGIPGLNPWNLTLAVITLAWAVKRMQRRTPWEVPTWALGTVFAYLAVLVVAFLHAAMDFDSFPFAARPTPMGYLTDELINPLKYCWLAFLIADSAQSRRYARLALGAILLLGVLYALGVCKLVPIQSLIGGSDFMRYRRRFNTEVGLHANDIGKVLSITFWGIVVTYRLWSGYVARIIQSGAASVVLLGLLMCFSRAGYATFIGIGFVVACVRFRKLLLLGPVVLVGVGILFPNVVERSVMGWDEGHGSGTYDWNEISAGRTGNLWPPVIDEIRRAPIIGQGRRAILRTAAYNKIKQFEEECPRTPHNGYLEVLIDAGGVGLLAVLSLFVTVLLLGTLLMHHQDPLAQGVGGLGVVSSIGCLINALSGGVLFPDQGMLGILAALMLVVRCSPFLARSAQKRTVRRVSTLRPVTQ